MTPELPDDPKRWPDDSFAILGVPRGAPEADIKRAYIRLIRRFKPEHHPDAFRKIREAYEDARSRTSWYRDDEAAEEAEPRPTAPVEDAPPAPATDPATRAWTLAIDGDHRTAYARLVELREQPSQPSEQSLRLYWLLAMLPGLDAERTRHDWLADALLHARLRNPAAELYRRELDADPAGALGPLYAKILSVPADENDVVPVGRWRLAAAGRHREFRAMALDLSILQDRLATDHAAAWLGLLGTAGDWLVGWSPNESLSTFHPAESRYCAGLEGVRHLELGHAYFFDKLEESEYIAKAMQWARIHYEQPMMLFLRAAKAGAWDVRAA